jgi:flagellar hook-associated protein 1
MSINHLLDIGRSALQAAQFGLDVTANNIANVNTPNYTRQRVIFAPGESVSIGGALHGSGVDVEGVQRVYDAFLGHQVHKAHSEWQDYQLREQTYTRIESILYPSEESNLGSLIDEFFNAWHDLANNPAGSAERQVVLTKAEELAANFRSLHGSLEEEMGYTNTLLEGYTDEINRLASEIALINKEIIRSQGPNFAPNDLLDRRDALIQELSGYLDPTLIQEESGSVTVLVSGGQPLVEGSSSFAVELVADPEDHDFYRVFLRGTDITETLQGGKIKGLVASREKMVGFQEDLDRLAAAFVNQFNQLHTSGVDLNGDPGLEFFAPLDVGVLARSTNQGGAGASVQEITDPSLLTLDDYEIRFTTSGTFDILNITQGTVVASGQSYTSGSPIEFEGIRVALSNLTGSPAAGDRFRVSVSLNTAREIRLNIQDPEQVAAAQEVDSLPGDNRNALAIADLRNAKVLEGGTQTFSGFYQALIGRVGSSVQDVTRKAEARESVYESMVDYQNSVSGVSIEEEEIRLLAYQHAYQAAAKFMSVVDQLMDDLLEL